MKNSKPIRLKYFTRSLLISVVYSLLACPGIFAAPDGLLRVHFIDVGYGDAVLIELPNQETLLIDAGDEAHGRKVLRYLQAKNISEITTAVITHPHKNHYGGLATLINYVPINRVFINGDENSDGGFKGLLERIYQRLIPVEVVSRGYQFLTRDDSLTVKVLHPANLQSSLNGNSIVTWLKYKDVSFLFTSDIEPKEQDDVLIIFPEVRAANVVTVPHHGGEISQAFVNAFKETPAVVSTGPNTWGLPLAAQLSKLQGRLFRTDQQGTIVIETDGRKLILPPAEDE